MTSEPELAGFTFEQVRGYPFPGELITAPTGARAAWVFTQHGIHNIWAAEGPDWNAVRLTDYQEDDGQELTNLRFTHNGAQIVYVRGGDHHANWPAPGNLQPNPGSSPVEPKMEVVVVPFSGGAPKVVAEGDRPAVSSVGDRVAFLKDQQVWSAPLDGAEPAKRLFFARGKCSDLRWSPDGRTLAFVNDRDDHSFIGLYGSDSKPLRYLEPSTRWDTCPCWSPDSSQIAFIRTPGEGARPRAPFELRPDPWSLWVAEVATGRARCLFEAPTPLLGFYSRMKWGVFLQWGADDRLVFRADFEGWPHLYSISTREQEAPRLLTPGDFMVDDITLSPDRKFAVYTANAGDDRSDIDRRHLWRTPIDAAEPERLISGTVSGIASGTGLEYNPAVTGDAATIVFLSADAQRPALPTVMPWQGGDALRLAVDQIPVDFPADRLVTPTSVILRAVDGVSVHCQRFERKAELNASDEEDSGRKPALVFVHGGPARQMLLGWPNMDYYANAYAINQYFAQLGYVVMSVNYRLGPGYGHAFQHPPQAGSTGASEYRDVLAAGDFLRFDPTVDPRRIGIWGGSYGGFLTALALGRNSDLFAAGVDFCGVHDWTVFYKDVIVAQQTRIEKLDIDSLLRNAWQSSPASTVTAWRSPVLLIHGDDDRNVEFHQTQDLARRLHDVGVDVEELIFPDETHALRCYRNLMRASHEMIRFFSRIFGTTESELEAR